MPPAVASGRFPPRNPWPRPRSASRWRSGPRGCRAPNAPASASPYRRRGPAAGTPRSVPALPWYPHSRRGVEIPVRAVELQPGIRSPEPPGGRFEHPWLASDRIDAPAALRGLRHQRPDPVHVGHAVALRQRYTDQPAERDERHAVRMADIGRCVEVTKFLIAAVQIHTVEVVVRDHDPLSGLDRVGNARVELRDVVRPDPDAEHRILGHRRRAHAGRGRRGGHARSSATRFADSTIIRQRAVQLCPCSIRYRALAPIAGNRSRATYARRKACDRPSVLPASNRYPVSPLTTRSTASATAEEMIGFAMAMYSYSLSGDRNTARPWVSVCPE